MLADEDYKAATVMLTFTSINETGRRCTTIEIIDDRDVESPEQFSVILVSASPVGIIAENTTCITIIDEPTEINRQLNA